MKKSFLIGIKDLTLIFRDPAALLLMLLAPFALTIGLGFVTGHFGSHNSSGISAIPVILVNQDGGQLGNALVQVFSSSDVKSLVTPTEMSDYTQAKAAVDQNKTAAAILIPAGFTNSIIPSGASAVDAAPVQVQLYANPTSPTSVGVVKTILEGFLNQVETQRSSGQVSIEQMVKAGLLQPSQVQQAASQMGAQMAAQSQNGTAAASAIQVVTQSDGASPSQSFQVDTLALIAPGMALMFLMYTVTYGGRSLLTERNQGTLPRLLVSPTRPAQILAGKVLGIFLTGVAQMLILILGTNLLFGLHWGDPLATLVLVLAAVAAATGWGLLIASFSKTTAQISSVGSALMLIFGLLGGSFFSMDALPGWVQFISHVSPNAWGMDGFTSLALGNGLASIATPVAALLLMAALLFGLSAFLINRRNFISA
jgi:ABC-type multidrug transport system, permease component